MIGNLLTKVLGTRNDKELKKRQPIIDKINSLEPEIKNLSDDQLRAKTEEFRERLSKGEELMSLIPEAFAVVREASVRATSMRHYDVQLLGGILLAEGSVTEQRTGEGKTLTATLPVYLHALTGKGAHLVTVNDYLAQRDAKDMGRIYEFLGMTTGVIVHGITDAQRQAAYLADITYGQNSEFGFDYLRDNMKTDPKRLVQRDLNFCIVDEVDSILIDEARTPLIISGPTESSEEDYIRANRAIPGLQKDSDYILDEKANQVSLTEDGIAKMEKRLRVDNLYEPKNITLLHHVQQALRAHTLFKKDVDYVVRDGRVIIVDENTGRMLPGRRFGDGLHGALEAKEHVKVQQETQTLATISYQNYFRMYETLSGMTGTADTEAVEFNKIYNLDVFVVPTNKPMIRKDQQDVIYRTAREKFNAITDEIETAYKAGQPVLVGTASVEKSELLSTLLEKRKIPHEILNAKNHAREADIIAKAGHSGNVTISTNMAGRGTDIVLGEGVREAGGLLVVGTERHDSRRIDNQLRGRSGRQGDPGRSKFFLSLEDDLLRIFASDRISAIMSRLGMEEGEAIESPMVSRAIEKAQKRVEEMHFSSRKHLLEYDDVMSQQRQVVYGRRHDALRGEGNIDFKEDAIAEVTGALCQRLSPEATNEGSWDIERITKDLNGELGCELDFKELDPVDASIHQFIDIAIEQSIKAYQEKMSGIPDEIVRKIESYIYLQIIDQAWRDHLQAMVALKESVSLRGYGQRDPLQEYKKEAYHLFEGLFSRIEQETIQTLLKMPKPQAAPERAPQEDVIEEKLNFSHPQADDVYKQPSASGNGGHQAPQEDKMIYHGSREASRDQNASASQQQTIKREGVKVGRNDPCPCGSGKKFKKCHGQPGANLSEIDGAGLQP